MMMDMLFEIFIILLLIVLNGLFAMSETAVVSARHARLQQMAQSGQLGAQVALDMAQTPNRFLSTVQIGITLVGITAGALGGANIAVELAEPLGDIPWLGAYAGTISLFIVVGITTFLSVVIGELVPKRIALANAERIATLVSQPMSALSVIAAPVVRLLSLATDGVLALLRLDAQSEEEVSEDEIRVMVQQAAAADIIEDAERDMVESIFRLNDRPLRSMMTPRPEIAWLDINASTEEIHDTIRTSNHSRFPVCDGDLDRVLGAVRAKNLLSDCLEGTPLDIRAVIQEPLFVPESMLVLNSLEDFKQTGVHMALLVDEYGEIEGLVTLIDILEAIVGDIPTADEIARPPIVQRDDGSWLVDGLISVADFKEAFEIGTLPSEDKYQTIGGFVVMMLGSLPSEGKHFGWGGLRFEVADMDGRRVDKVLINSAPDEAE
jgi:putative hemolysin